MDETKHQYSVEEIRELAEKDAIARERNALVTSVGNLAVVSDFKRFTQLVAQEIALTRNPSC